MNVKQLIAKLSKMPQTATVILQKDPEGNGYDTLEGLSTARCDLEDECQPMWAEDGETEIAFDDKSAGGTACVVLRP